MKYILYIQKFEYNIFGEKYIFEPEAIYKNKNYPNLRYRDNYPDHSTGKIELKLYDTLEEAKKDQEFVNIGFHMYFDIFEYENGNIGKCVTEKLED